jgi:hypothetical protein
MKCHGAMQAMVLLITASIFLSGCSGRPAEDARPPLDVLPAKPAPEQLTHFELDLGKQQEIWDAEHVTFELERRFGPRLLAAIADQDETKLSACLREGFSGAVMDHIPETTRRHGPVVELRKANDVNVAPVGPEVVVRSLIAPVAHFQDLQGSSFRVLNIERNDSDQCWHLRVRLTLSGMDRDGSIAFYESEHLARCTIQDDRKIDQTAILDWWQIRSEIWRKSTHLLMEEVSRQVGISDLPLRDNWKVSLEKIDQYGFQFAVEDFDQDGDLDIALASFDGARMLLRSEGGTRFVNVAGKMGITKYTRGSNAVAAWFDYDNDGFPDLLLGNSLFHNEQGKRFVDITRSAGLFFEPECMGCSVADYNGDGLLDLYVMYQRDLNSSQADAGGWIDDPNAGRENVLFRNLGKGRFLDVTHSTGSGGGLGTTHAASWFFFDQDHWPDLYIANEFGSNVILRNQGDGTFADVSKTTLARDFPTSMGVATGDLNNDGHTEIYVANMFSKMGRRIIGQLSEDDYPPGIFARVRGSCAGNRLYSKPSANQPYEEFGEAMEVSSVGWAYAPAMADLDNDGWLDLYATTGFMSFDRKKPDG